MNYPKITNFFFELAMLKREKHRGFALAGVNQELGSLADHITRTALIGSVLAHLEKANPYKVIMMILIHDIPETRIGDHHKIAARYLDTKNTERAVFVEQIRDLPEELQKEWLKLYDEKEDRTTKEGIVAQDADWLECALSAKEFYNIGYKDMQVWIDNVREALETESAKKLLKEIEKQENYDWARGLEKMTYTRITN